MKISTQQATPGFTIIEVLIVIAIMGFLLAMAIIFVLGDTEKADFTVGVNALKEQIEQVINETSNGYYHDQENFSCTPGSGAAPSINPIPVNPGTDTQAQNSGCIFLGKIIQFSPNSHVNQYFVYPIAGNQFVSGNTPTTISASQPALVYNDYDTQALEYGLTAQWMKNASGVYTSAVAFLAGDSQGNIAGCNGACNGTNLNSGAEPLSLYYDSSAAGNFPGNYTPTSLKNDINNGKLSTTSQVTLCVAAGNKSGLIQVGGTGSLAVSLTIYDGSNC